MASTPAFGSAFGRLPVEVPDCYTIEDFIFDEKYGRHSIQKSLNPFTCGITGKTRTTSEVTHLVSSLANGLAKTLEWSLPAENQWERVASIFSENSIDTLPVIWAIHRLCGVVSPASTALSAAELEEQLLRSKSKVIFTSRSLLQTAIKASRAAKIPDRNNFLIEPAGAASTDDSGIRFDTIQDILSAGRGVRNLTSDSLVNRKNRNRIAFLCFSSGTTGLPKGVVITHQSIIANIIQACRVKRSDDDGNRRRCLCVLPQSHVYSLVLTCQAETYMGSEVVILPSFKLDQLLSAIKRFKLQNLYLVPTIMVNILSNLDLVAKYDLMSSTVDVYIGAAPLGPEVLTRVEELFPNWKILQGYGLTEAGPVVSLTPRNDIWIGSSGIPMDGIRCRLISEDGHDIDDWSRPGELLVKSPALALGYLDNKQATQQTFTDGWLYTGDVAVIKKSRKGNYHIFIVDRLKDMLKVKGIQVSPTELEAHILLYPGVAEVAVIGVEDARSGEVPMAFVVPTATSAPGGLQALASSIQLHVEKHKASYKWLRGGVKFIDALPKTSSGKANRRALRDGERNRTKNASNPRL